MKRSIAELAIHLSSIHPLTHTVRIIDSTSRIFYENGMVTAAAAGVFCRKVLNLNNNKLIFMTNAYNKECKWIQTMIVTVELYILCVLFDTFNILHGSSCIIKQWKNFQRKLLYKNFKMSFLTNIKQTQFGSLICIILFVLKLFFLQKLERYDYVRANFWGSLI